MLTLLGCGALTSGALDRALELADNAAQAGDALTGPDGEAGVVSSSAATLLAPVPRPPRIRDYLDLRGAHGRGRAPGPARVRARCRSATSATSTRSSGRNRRSDGLPTPTSSTTSLRWASSSASRTQPVGQGGGRGGRRGDDLQRRQRPRHPAVRDVDDIGPSKGKDFCTVMGPCITTMDELDEWNIELSALVNGELWSRARPPVASTPLPRYSRGLRTARTSSRASSSRSAPSAAAAGSSWTAGSSPVTWSSCPRLSSARCATRWARRAGPGRRGASRATTARRGSPLASS